MPTQLKSVLAVIVLTIFAVDDCTAQEPQSKWMNFLLGTWSIDADDLEGTFLVEKSAVEIVHTAKLITPNGDVSFVGVYVWDKKANTIQAFGGSADSVVSFHFDNFTDKKMSGTNPNDNKKPIAYTWIDADTFKHEGDNEIVLHRKKE